jgi:hypothetical protein
MSGRHCQNTETRERDARIYELELGLLPSDPKELRRWLWTELMFEEQPHLRETFQRVDELIMAARHAPAHTAPEVRRIEHAFRGNSIAESRKEPNRIHS